MVSVDQPLIPSGLAARMFHEEDMGPPGIIEAWRDDGPHLIFRGWILGREVAACCPGGHAGAWVYLTAGGALITSLEVHGSEGKGSYESAVHRTSADAVRWFEETLAGHGAPERRRLKPLVREALGQTAKWRARYLAVESEYEGVE